MAIREREITGKFYNADGSVAAGKILKIELDRNDYSLIDLATVQRFEVSLTLTASGVIPTGSELWTNADGNTGSYYMVTEPDGTIWYFSLALGDDSIIDITTLRVAGSPMANVNPVYEYIDSKLGPYLNNYVDLADAIALLGANQVCLHISDPATVAEDLIVPENITVVFCEDGLLTVTSTFTVTIRSLAPHGSRQLFAGSGDVIVGGPANAIPEINLAWWAGPANASDVTHELDQAIASLSAQLGGTLFVPAGTWKTSGGRFDRTTSTFTNAGIFIPNGCKVKGQGMNHDAARGTVIELTDTNANAFLFCTEGSGADRGLFRGVALEDMVLKCPATTGVGLLLTGQYPNSGFNVSLVRVDFYNGENGLRMQDHSDALDWEAIAIYTQSCIFSYQGTAGFYCNLINSLVCFDHPLFLVNANKDGCQIDNIGMFRMSNWDARSVVAVTYATGGGGDYPTTPNTDGARSVVYINGAHNQIHLDNGWDEQFQYSIYVNSSNSEGTLNLTSNLLQGYVMIKDNSIRITSMGNKYYHGQFRDSTAAGSNGTVFSYGDYVQDSALGTGGPIGTARQFDDFVSASKVIVKHATVNADFKVDNGVMNSFIHDGVTFFTTPLTTPNVGIGSTLYDKALLRLGTLDAALAFENYFDIQRAGTGNKAGMFDFIGNQTGYTGYNFNGRIGRSTKVVIASGPTPQLDCKAGDIFEITPAETMTISAIDLIAGQRITLRVISNGTDYVVTLDSGTIKSSGAISTGATVGKIHNLSLESDGTFLIQKAFVGNL